MRTVIIRLFTTVMVSFVPVICSKLTLTKSRLSERPLPERDAPGRRTAGVESVAAIDDETKRTEKGTKESKRAAAEDGTTGRNRHPGIIRVRAGTCSRPGQRLAALASPSCSE